VWSGVIVVWQCHCDVTCTVETEMHVVLCHSVVCVDSVDDDELLSEN